MFASNFPVDKYFSSSSYQSFWNTYFETTIHFNDNEKEDLFVKNAERIYRI
jgi:predicted TIM-barrel fold metal-dependent hydrolase